ncbi:hypothetical protein [Maribacter sp.]|uniref:hypothetical protein n=1 Tax=Maribacter sp. TaxID=1897614 RepID=UPI0025B838FE|nr:hypothetical protein [Maribacter sp.]
MKLAQEQLDFISSYLCKKELVQIDIKMEILDHMANSIEKRIETYGDTFSDAFNAEALIWERELSNSTNPIIGFLYSGPKMLIDKCARKLKFFYLYTSVVALFFTIFFGFILKDLNSNIVFEFLRYLYGCVFTITLSVIVIIHFAIKKTQIKSSFSFLYKTQAVGFAFFYLIYNPLFLDILGLFKNGNFTYISFLIYNAMLFFSPIYFFIYKEHLRVLEKFSHLKIADL